jgi:hypothetical protein
MLAQRHESSGRGLETPLRPPPRYRSLSIGWAALFTDCGGPMPVNLRTKPLRKKLSGSARRKLARQQATEDPKSGELMKRIRVGQLETVAQWRREIGRVYREMRFHTIRTEEGTRLVYVAEIGARLAKMQEELESIEALRSQLEQLQGMQPAALITQDTFTSTGD